MEAWPEKDNISFVQWFKHCMKNNPKVLDAFDQDRVIEMAWEDRTPFEAIFAQFGLREAEVIALMRTSLLPKSFARWRRRVQSGQSQKHAKKRSPDMDRFKCSRQRSISLNKISKR